MHPEPKDQIRGASRRPHNHHASLRWDERGAYAGRRCSSFLVFRLCQRISGALAVGGGSLGCPRSRTWSLNFRDPASSRLHEGKCFRCNVLQRHGKGRTPRAPRLTARECSRMPATGLHPARVSSYDGVIRVRDGEETRYGLAPPGTGIRNRRRPRCGGRGRRAVAEGHRHPPWLSDPSLGRYGPFEARLRPSGPPGPSGPARSPGSAGRPRRAVSRLAGGRGG